MKIKIIMMFKEIKLNNKAFNILLMLLININTYSANTDSLKVYLEKDLNNPITVDLVFKNISCDTIILRSCFDICSDEMTTPSGLLPLVYADGQSISLPQGTEKVILKYNNCRTIIAPQSQISLRIPLSGYFQDYLKYKTIGVEFWLNYVFLLKGHAESKRITTNYVELWNCETDMKEEIVKDTNIY
ncbi:hypothetical protein AGMMS49574_25990 [Bacteroidia bacterium]|nr:hypothetical protein AGMMS49574_25990 [Bacteroidia bacterium]